MTRNALGRGLGALIREPEALVGTGAANAGNLASTVEHATEGEGVAGKVITERESGQAAERASARPDPGEGLAPAVTGGGPAAMSAPASVPGAQRPIPAAFASP